MELGNTSWKRNKLNSFTKKMSSPIRIGDRLKHSKLHDQHNFFDFCQQERSQINIISEQKFFECDKLV